jgi:hypothetical protein
MLTLLWGLPGDSPLYTVYQELNDLGFPTVFLDQREILQTEITLSVGSKIEGEICTPNFKIDLNQVTGVYLRPYDSRRLPMVVEAGNIIWLILSDEIGTPPM